MDLLIADDTTAASVEAMNPLLSGPNLHAFDRSETAEKSIRFIPDSWSGLHSAKRERTSSLLQVRSFPKSRVIVRSLH